jgi:hypothetical protein
VNRQLPGPVASTRRGAFQLLLPVVGAPLEPVSGLDPVDGGVGADGHAQQPQQLVGGDADLGWSWLGWAHRGHAAAPAGVVAVGHIRPDLAGGPVDVHTGHNPHQRPSRSASCRIPTAFRMRTLVRTAPRIGAPQKDPSRSLGLSRLLFLPGRYRSGRVLIPGRTSAEGCHAQRTGHGSRWVRVTPEHQ